MSDATDWLALHHWRRRAALWGGAILVGLSAIAFAAAANACYAGFLRILHAGRYWPLLLTPLTFALLSWLSRGRLRATRGSGIPQTISALQVDDETFRARLLSLRVAAGKIGLTLLALAGGASVGREGPTVHVGASLMYSIGRRLGFTEAQVASRFILAGGAAGIAAAFNTPLAGIVFAIEEMANAFEHRMSGVVLTAVIIAGVVSLGLLGDYAYFGKVGVVLAPLQGWIAVLLCGVACGLAGGVFSRLILLHGLTPLAWVARCRERAPILFAAACGLVLALVGLSSGDAVYGTGYEQAHAILQGTANSPGGWFGLAKFGANVVSYWAGIPGGIFSPALAVGAGIGDAIATLMPSAPSPAVVLLGMAAYLAGVTQAPLTSAIISMELTDNQAMVIPVLAVCLLARFASSLVCHMPVYKALAERIVAESAPLPRHEGVAEVASAARLR